MLKDQPTKTTKLHTILIHKVQLHPRHLKQLEAVDLRDPLTHLPKTTRLPTVTLTNSLAATVRSCEDEITTLQNQIGILINQNQHLMNKQDHIMCMLPKEMDHNESRRAS